MAFVTIHANVKWEDFGLHYTPPKPKPRDRDLYNEGLEKLKRGKAYEASGYFYRASLNDHAPSIYQIGLMLETGNGAPMNLVEAYKCYEKASELKYVPAMLHLAELYYGNQNTNPATFRRRIKDLLNNAMSLAEGKDKTLAKTMLLNFCEHEDTLNNNFQQIFSLWLELENDRNLSKRERADIKYKLAQVYDEGIFVERDRYHAVELMNEAADMGNPNAKYETQYNWDHWMI